VPEISGKGGLRSHHSRMVWDFVREQHGRLWLEFLPAYAPELNPVEYLWSHWKQHELPNFCQQTFGELSHPGATGAAPNAASPLTGDGLLGAAELFPFLTILYNTQ
jgi:DDE superfamily endonuclease